MNTTELFPHPATAPAQAALGHPIGRLAGFIERADTGTRAALARMNPEAMRPRQVAVLARALIHAGLDPEGWRPATWSRWSLVAHGMALTGHAKGRLGQQLAQAGVAESRVTKLLVSREDAFLQVLPRLLRLLASKQVSPNWYELSELIFKNDAIDPIHQQEAENLRLKLAGAYFSAQAKTAKA